MKDLYSGVIYDAMYFDLGLKDFVINPSIFPVFELNEPVFGPAFTCLGKRVRDESEIDDFVRLKMFNDFTSNCIQVIDGKSNMGVAHFGDISGILAAKFGAVGAVIDGYTRDVSILKKNNFPVAAYGARMEDAYGKWQIVDYQVPIEITGVAQFITVNPGDYIFMDMDGGVVIPQNAFGDVVERAYTRLENEDEIRREIKNIDTVEQLIEMYNRRGRW